MSGNRFRRTAGTAALLAFLIGCGKASPTKAPDQTPTPSVTAPPEGGKTKPGGKGGEGVTSGGFKQGE